jgi:hypothetical protein
MSTYAIEKNREIELKISSEIVPTARSLKDTGVERAIERERERERGGH